MCSSAEAGSTEVGVVSRSFPVSGAVSAAVAPLPGGAAGANTGNVSRNKKRGCEDL